MACMSVRDEGLQTGQRSWPRLSGTPGRSRLEPRALASGCLSLQQPLPYSCSREGERKRGQENRRRCGNVENFSSSAPGETDLGQTSCAPGIPLRRISLPDIVMSTVSPSRNGMRRVA